MISIRNPFKTMDKLKGIFVPLKCYFRIKVNDHYPVLWCSVPDHIHIISRDVMWKDKYDTPRYENCPCIWVHIFGLDFIWYWDLDHSKFGNKYYVEEYWEQALWYLYYYNTESYGRLKEPNLEKAKESWPWTDYKTNESTWIKEYEV